MVKTAMARQYRSGETEGVPNPKAASSWNMKISP